MVFLKLWQIEKDAQHVDLMPDNPHVRDIQGGYSHGETIYERK